MVGLIEEIERDASDDEKSVAQLLRRMKIATSKLNLGAVEEWVDHELDGYPDDATVPDYRVIGGTPMSHHITHGWRMLAASSDQQSNMLFSSIFFRPSITEVERNADSQGKMFLSYPGWLERVTLPRLSHVNKIGMHADQGKFRALLSGVRNRCLEWALSMERAGVTGEGLSFSVEEKKVAQSVVYNLFGDNPRVNNNSTDNSTNQVFHGDVFHQLTGQIQMEIADQAVRDSLLSAILEMKAQSNSAGFAKAYATFMGLAADHIGVLQWAIPLLAAHIR